MKRKFVSTIAFMLAFVSFANAQSSDGFQFEKLVHDFGKIKEENGKALYKFKFNNKGKKPIIITNVKTSCGCTTPDWSKKPVLPGKSGFVSVQYDPHDRPGAFDKEITIFNNITSSPVSLKIKGIVVEKTKKIEDIYRYQIGSIRVKSRHLAFTKLNNTQTRTQSVEFINVSDKPIDLEVNKKQMRSFLGVSISSKTVAPKETGIIKVTYYAAKNVGMWGYTTTSIPLLINGKKPSGYPLSVSATIVEDFSKLTKSELANAPTMDFENTSYNFGTVKEGKEVIHEFKFKNNGKRDLIIRKTSSSCGCTAVETKNVIKPGESSFIKATFRTIGKKGKQYKSVTVIANVPGKNKNGSEKNTVVLRITGEVTDK